MATSKAGGGTLKKLSRYREAKAGLEQALDDHKGEWAEEPAVVLLAVLSKSGVSTYTIVLTETARAKKIDEAWANCAEEILEKTWKGVKGE